MSDILDRLVSMLGDDPRMFFVPLFVACKFNHRLASALQHLHFIIEHNRACDNREYFFDGRWWCAISNRELAGHLDVLGSPQSIQRQLKKAIDAGWLRQELRQDGRRFNVSHYSIDYEVACSDWVTEGADRFDVLFYGLDDYEREVGATFAEALDAFNSQVEPRDPDDALYRRNRPKVLVEGAACVYCGDVATQVDHVIPRSQGGTSELVNLVPCCQPCNRDKYDQTPWQWLGGGQ